jgi:hypothetical protein
MSEFKFACPVCGQHITADSSTSGGQLDCPTCFRKIVVPQAPASGDSKFIISAAQVAKPRPASATSTSLPPPSASSGRSPIPIVAVGLGVLLCAVGAGVYLFRDKLFKKAPGEQAQVTTPTNAPGKRKTPTAPKVTHPIPTNITWTLELTNTDFPEATAVGSIHGSGFLCEKAVLQAYAARDAKTPPHCELNLRQGKSSPPDLGLTVQLFAQQGEELAGKTVEIAPDRPPPVPKVTLRWKDDQDKAVNKNFNEGYTLKVAFGEAVNGRMSGKIYIAVPDDAKSFVAGTFEAEIRKAAPPKPKQPKVPKTVKAPGK